MDNIIMEEETTDTKARVEAALKPFEEPGYLQARELELGCAEAKLIEAIATSALHIAKDAELTEEKKAEYIWIAASACYHIGKERTLLDH